MTDPKRQRGLMEPDPDLPPPTVKEFILTLLWSIVFVIGLLDVVGLILKTHG